MSVAASRLAGLALPPADRPPGRRGLRGALALTLLAGGVLALLAGRSTSRGSSGTGGTGTPETDFSYTFAGPAWLHVALPVLAVCLTGAALGLWVARRPATQLEGGVGEASRRPATVAAAAVPIRRAVGNVRLDLRGLARARGRATLRLTVGVGDVKVQLPPGVRVDLDLRTGRGTILTLDDSRDERWENVVRRTTWTATSAAAPPHPPRPPLSLHVVARVGEGDIDISGHPADPEAQP